MAAADGSVHVGSPAAHEHKLHTRYTTRALAPVVHAESSRDASSDAGWVGKHMST